MLLKLWVTTVIPGFGVNILNFLNSALKGYIPPNTSMDSWKYDGITRQYIPTQLGRFPAYMHVVPFYNNYIQHTKKKIFGDTDISKFNHKTHIIWSKYAGNRYKSLGPLFNIRRSKKLWQTPNTEHLLYKGESDSYYLWKKNGLPIIFSNAESKYKTI